MRTYAEIDRDARPGSPFSGGTEGYAWQENWCGRPCAHDAAFQRDEPGAEGCPLVLVAFLGKTPAEWMEQPWRQITGAPEGQTAPVLGDTYHCVEFRDEDDPGGGEPVPVPDPPDQEVLFGREQAEGVRMLTRIPQPQEVRT